MKLQNSATTLVTIANAAELTCAIVQSVVGDDVADTFNKAPLTRAMIHTLAVAEIKNNIANQTGVK